MISFFKYGLYCELCGTWAISSLGPSTPTKNMRPFLKHLQVSEYGSRSRGDIPDLEVGRTLILSCQMIMSIPGNRCPLVLILVPIYTCYQGLSPRGRLPLVWVPLEGINHHKPISSSSPHKSNSLIWGDASLVFQNTGVCPSHSQIAQPSPWEKKRFILFSHFNGALK